MSLERKPNTGILTSCWILIASLSTVGVTACLNILSTKLSFFELLTLRYLAVTIVAFIFLITSKVSIFTKHWRIHLLRFVAGMATVCSYTWAAMKMPVCTVTVLQYTSPIYISLFLIIVTLKKGENPDFRFLGLVLLAFFGVYLMLNPEILPLSTMIIGLLCGFFTSISILILKDLGKKGEPIARSVFIYNFMGLVVGLILNSIMGDWNFENYSQFPLLIMFLLTTIAQFSRTQGWGSGNTHLNTIFQYSSIPFSVILDVLLFSAPLLPTNALGIAIVTVSSFIIIFLLIHKNKH